MTVTRYLISFDDGTMNIPAEEMPAVGEAAHAVLREAKAAGVWVHGGGLYTQQATLISIDGSVRPGPFPETKAVLGGFAIVNVGTREEAIEGAKRWAGACRCPQEVREIMNYPEV
jgi:hypothetical protein